MSKAVRSEKKRLFLQAMSPSYRRKIKTLTSPFTYSYIWKCLKVKYKPVFSCFAADIINYFLCPCDKPTHWYYSEHGDCLEKGKIPSNWMVYYGLYVINGRYAAIEHPCGAARGPAGTIVSTHFLLNSPVAAVGQRHRPMLTIRDLKIRRRRRKGERHKNNRFN